MEPVLAISPTRTAYTYDAVSHRYRDSRTGQYVSWEVVQNRLYTALDRYEREARAASLALRERTVSLAQYESAMMRLIKNTHLTSAALAKGGWHKMAQSDYGRVGREVRTQYDFLRSRIAAIVSGAQALDGTLDVRSGQYVQAGKQTMSMILRLEMRLRGFDEHRRVLDRQADHCRTGSRPGCVEQAALSWQKIDRGVLVPIAAAQCLGGCKCTEQFRNSLTGEVAR